MKFFHHLLIVFITIMLLACEGEVSQVATTTPSINNEGNNSLNKTSDSKDFFITTWKTDENNQITIPTKGDGYNYSIDWGDNFTEDNLTKNSTHSYENSGTYTIKISNNFPRIAFSEQPNLLSVEQWGTQKWTTMKDAFLNNLKIRIKANDNPNLSEVTDMSGMFRGVTIEQDITFWDVSNVVNMKNLFAETNFNQNISSWSVSKVTNMSGMFGEASKFNQDLSVWDVSHVIDMSEMFIFTEAFNQDISAWNVSNVRSMEHMLDEAENFSSKNYDKLLIAWSKLPLQRDVKLGVSLKYTSNAQTSRDLIISQFNWKITDFGMELGTFANAGDDQYALENQYIKFDASKSSGNIVEYKWTEGETLLSNAFTFKKNDFTEGEHLITLTVTDNQNITTIDSILITIQKPFITTWKTDATGDTNNNQIRIPTCPGANYFVDWGDGKTSKGVTRDITHTYENAGVYTVKIWGKFSIIYFGKYHSDAKKILSVEEWGSIKWSTMYRAFDGCSNLVINALDAPTLSRVKNMHYMFANTKKFNQDINSWNVSHVKNMSLMFANSSFNQNLDLWNVSNVTNMFNMFTEARNFNQNLENWNISNVKKLSSILDDTNLSSKNYDNLLNGWSKLSLQKNLSFSVSAQYSDESEESRALIISKFNWTIEDEGKAN